MNLASSPFHMTVLFLYTFSWDLTALPCTKSAMYQKNPRRADESINYHEVSTDTSIFERFMPPALLTSPPRLFYEKYGTDNLWNPNRGLETAGIVVGLPLNQDFFRAALEKHLSYPLHTTPWFWSPFISVNSNPMAIDQGNKGACNPQSVFKIDVLKILSHYRNSHNRERLFIYSLEELVMMYKLWDSIDITTRPYWKNEYLILKRVPAEAITFYNLFDFRRMCRFTRLLRSVVC